MIRKKEREHERVLKLSFGDTRPGIHDAIFAIIIPNLPNCARHRLVLIGTFLDSSYERFHFF